jgi:hypothetical protein
MSEYFSARIEAKRIETEPCEESDNTLDGLHVRTTREVAAIMGLSRATVQRIEHQALNKVRLELEKLGITKLEDIK